MPPSLGNVALRTASSHVLIDVPGCRSFHYPMQKLTCTKTGTVSDPIFIRYIEPASTETQITISRLEQGLNCCCVFPMQHSHYERVNHSFARVTLLTLLDPGGEIASLERSGCMSCILDPPSPFMRQYAALRKRLTLL